VFLDDRRSFANVDALLTRLAPVSTVYVACTEGGDFDAGSGGGGGGGGGGKKDRGAASASAEVAALLKRLASVVESRDDVAPGGRGGDGDGDPDGATDGKIDVRVLPSLSRSKATSLAESTLRRLLGGEGTEAHLAYRGDRHLAEEPMVLWCLGCLFSADGGSHFAPSSSHGGGASTIATTTTTMGTAEARAAEEGGERTASCRARWGVTFRWIERPRRRYTCCPRGRGAVRL
jgi:hypothetical protein